MKRVFRRPYIYWTVALFLLYLVIAIIISGFYNTFQLIIRYADTVNWWKLSFSLILSLIIGVLVAINSVYLFIRYRERKACKKETTLASLGTAGGLITGICPLCVTGLLPLLFGALGISFSFGMLPLQGIEVQLFTVGILAISLYSLQKKSYGTKSQ